MKRATTFKKDFSKFTAIKKEQLAKVIGGNGGAEEDALSVLKSRHDTAKNAIGNIR